MTDSWFDDDAMPSPAAPAREVLSISQLNAQARMLLERGLGSVWLEGEISNLARPASGHWYFSLKDESAQVRCAMFRNRSMLVRFPVKDGARVLARGRVSLYEARGEFQVVIDHLEEAGEGALRRRFEELKRKLLAEGLFDAARKKPLPTLPRRIGVITSPTGAALRDILHILQRRFPAVPVLVYPVAVQGEAAPREIVQALQLAAARRDCDVLILARGGGSLEDLMAFNEESVARAIYACDIPIISGVGHETDVTIADFVADERAPTPSGAAERSVPDSAEYLRAFAAHERNVVQCLAPQAVVAATDAAAVGTVAAATLAACTTAAACAAPRRTRAAPAACGPRPGRKGPRPPGERGSPPRSQQPCASPRAAAAAPGRCAASPACRDPATTAACAGTVRALHAHAERRQPAGDA